MLISPLQGSISISRDLPIQNRARKAVAMIVRITQVSYNSTPKGRAHHLGLAPELVPDIEGKEDGQVDIYRTLHQPMQYTQT